MPRRLRASFLPIPILIVLLATTYFAVDPSVFFDPAWLILLGNTVFVTGVGLVVAYIASRNYAVTGRIQVLLLGSGVLAFGVGGALAALVRGLPDGANLNVAIYNTGALLGAAFHVVAAFLLLAGISPEAASARRRTWLLVGYGGSGAAMALVAIASLDGLFPPFFVQGVGPTALRQVVLGAADTLFVFSFLVFAGTYLRTRERFLYWYAGALALTAISLTAFLVQHSVGSPVGWVGRCSQYLGGVYFLASLVTAVRTAHRRGTSLDEVLTASLSGAEEKFRALAENLPDVIRRFDRDLRHIYVNAAGRRLYGKPAGAIVGRRMEEVAPPGADTRVWNERIETVFRTGEHVEIEEFLPTPNGTRFYQSRCVPEHGPDGAVSNVLVVSRDLTEHRRAEEAVRRSEERYRSLFSKMTEGFAIHEIVTDERGKPVDYRFLDVNPAFERLTGLARDHVVGATFRSALPGEDPRWLEEYGRVALTGEPAQFDNYAPTLGRHYEVYAFRSAPRQFAVLFIDVTQRKAAEAALAQAKAAAEEANRQKDQFLAVLSHELRNPLAPIRNSVYILARAAPESEQARRAHAVIDRQAAQLARLVDDLLDLTRISQNKIQLEPRRLELGELVHRAVEDQRSLFENAGVRLDVDAVAGPVLVDADPSRIAQVVGNLLQNAAKFTPRGGKTRVSVSAERAERRAVVRVSDTGIGMAPEMVSRLFRPFVQADVTLDRSKGGLGLGLALVKRLVELHSGEVVARSAGLGRGTELVVRLPLAQDDATAPPPGPGAAPPRRRVLVIEDNADAGETLRDLLELAGHEVALARTGPEGLDKARQLRPDVVLCDIGLPGADGYEVARAFRADAALGRTYLVAMSGYTMPSDVERARAAGFQRHLAKPATFEAVEEILAGLPEGSPRDLRAEGGEPAR